MNQFGVRKLVSFFLWFVTCDCSSFALHAQVKMMLLMAFWSVISLGQEMNKHLSRLRVNTPVNPGPEKGRLFVTKHRFDHLLALTRASSARD